MTNPPLYSAEIARSLMHGLPFNGMPMLPALVSEKLNGLRCVYMPGKGFYSKTGKRWRDGVLDHIVVNSDIPVDGELYCRDMHLQEIVENVGVNNLIAGPRAAEIKLHAFDVIDKRAPAIERYETVMNVRNASTNVIAHHQMIYELVRDYKIGYDYAKRVGMEGLMVKTVGSRYARGRTGQLLKLKFFHHDEAPVVRFVEGEGKAEGCVGAFVFNSPRGAEFEIGTMQLSYETRRRLWAERDRPYVARYKYVALSTDLIPQNASVEAVWEDQL
jgi:DNA ligase-1